MQNFMADGFSQLRRKGGPKSDAPAHVNYFRESIKKIRPRSTDSDIDAAVAACRAQLDASDLPDKLKRCVLLRLDAEWE
jgi:hypothetical protein